MTGDSYSMRRQQFLTEDFVQHQIDRREKLLIAFAKELALPDTDKEGASLLHQALSGDHYEALSLRYTAGQPIGQLRPQITNVIEAYERYQKALAEYEEAPDMSPLGLDQLDDYERAMQIIGLCVLMHRPDLLKRIAALIDPGYKGEDTLYEDILAFYLTDRIELDEWYHEAPYTPLIRAMYEEDDQIAARLLNDYVNNWYPAFKYAPWHDGHLRTEGTDGDYFGYWAFEAGAVAYLCNIDDSQITHMVYPKDLVAWAREYATEYPQSAPVVHAQPHQSVPAGQPCPETGWWFTPAKADSRRYFKAGDVMPAISSDYGETLWQWAQDQSPPML
ncbi:PoNe immunity protein domain-containing protein [Thiosocius teredinicola]|uniref:PoNe immunity protein domain-containing protein n=1 Tax=Thiosocius teredinicola TaxID=1973002 RepID=UPI000F7AD49D